MSYKNAAESMDVKEHDTNMATEEPIEVLNDAEIDPFISTETMKIQAIQDVRAIVQQLEKNNPGITEGLGTALGAGAGAVGSITALSSLGISGLSAAGVTTGLSAAGGLIGGGMLLGIGVLATPVAALGVLGYSLAKKQKQANNAAALGEAAKKICDVKARLMQDEGAFSDELAYIKTTLETLTRTKTV